MQFLNLNKSPNSKKGDDLGKKVVVRDQIIEDFEQDEGAKNVHINFGMLSESLEEVDDQYKDSEFYSPLK